MWVSSCAPSVFLSHLATDCYPIRRLRMPSLSCHHIQIEGFFRIHLQAKKSTTIAITLVEDRFSVGIANEFFHNPVSLLVVFLAGFAFGLFVRPAKIVNKNKGCFGQLLCQSQLCSLVRGISFDSLSELLKLCQSDRDRFPLGSRRRRNLWWRGWN